MVQASLSLSYIGEWGTPNGLKRRHLLSQLLSCTYGLVARSVWLESKLFGCEPPTTHIVWQQIACGGSAANEAAETAVAAGNAVAAAVAP